MTKRTREYLQERFKQGSRPSGEDFKDFIESTLNVAEDGIEKPGDTSTAQDHSLR